MTPVALSPRTPSSVRHCAAALLATPSADEVRRGRAAAASPRNARHPARRCAPRPRRRCAGRATATPAIGLPSRFRAVTRTTDERPAWRARGRPSASGRCRARPAAPAARSRVRAPPRRCCGSSTRSPPSRRGRCRRPRRPASPRSRRPPSRTRPARDGRDCRCTACTCPARRVSEISRVRYERGSSTLSAVDVRRPRPPSGSSRSSSR